MPTLDQIEQINKKLIEFGNEREILRESGEEIRIIPPPEQNLDEGLSQLISAVDEDTESESFSLDEIIEKGENKVPTIEEIEPKEPDDSRSLPPKEKTLEEEMLEHPKVQSGSTPTEKSSLPDDGWESFDESSFSNSSIEIEQPHEEKITSPAESDFDFSGLDGLDSLDDLDGLMGSPENLDSNESDDFSSFDLSAFDQEPLSEDDIDLSELSEIEKNFTSTAEPAPSEEDSLTDSLAEPEEEIFPEKEETQGLDDFNFEQNELDDIESFLSGEKDSLDVGGDLSFDSDMDFNADFDESIFSSESEGDFDTNFADFSSTEKSSEDPEPVEGDDFFHDLMSEANKNAAEVAIGNGEELFALDEFSEEEEEAPVETEAEPTLEAEEDSPFGEYMETSIDEFELEDSIDGNAPKKKDLSQTIFSLSGSTEEKKEFYLSENQIFEIKKNLTYLPRNLKIAVEEFIANEETKETIVQELTNLILANSSAKKIASVLERETGESIKLPARYRAMSGYDIERQQNSFMYKFLTRYLPAALISISVTAGIAFLFWIVFGIVTPWSSASSKYREGRKAILKGQYEKAESCFRLAYFGNKKKSWPYTGFPNRTEALKYADLYEKNRQYNYAEDKYRLLLQNHWEKSSHLKKTKLKYAHMLSESLGRHSEAAIQLKEIKEGGRVPVSGIKFEGIGNDADADFALARVYFLWGDDENRYDYYDEAMNLLSSYLVSNGKKVFFKVFSYELWYLAKRNETQKMATLIKNNFFTNKKQENQFKKAKKDLRIWNDIIDCFLSAHFTQEPVGQLMNLLEKENPSNPELNWHRARQQGLSARPDLEKRTLTHVINLLKITPYQTRREYRIQILATARIGEINYNDNKIIEAKTKFINAIQTYESLLSRGVLQPTSEYGKIYANLGDLYYYHAGNLDAAYMQFSKAEEQKFRSHLMDYKQGFIDYWRGDFKNAKQQFYFVLEMVPDNKNAIFAMANTMLEDFNLSHAQSHFVRYIKIQNEILPGFGSSLNTHRKDQSAILQSLEAAHNNLGVTYYRQYERNNDVDKRDKAMLQFTRSLEYFNVLGRKDKIRAGATVEGLRKYSIPSLNSVAALNQHEIWYREPTPSLSIMKQIPFDLDSLDMAEIMEFNSVLVTEKMEELLEPLQSSSDIEFENGNQKTSSDFSVDDFQSDAAARSEEERGDNNADKKVETEDSLLEKQSESEEGNSIEIPVTPEEAGAYLIN